MLRVFEKRGATGQFIETQLDKISSVSLVWIDAFNPSKDELDQVSKAINIPVSDLLEYDDPDERPRLHDKETYSEMVFSYPIQARGIRVAPVFIFLYSRMGIFTLHKKEVSSTEKIVKFVLDHPESMTSSSDLLHYYMDTLTSEYFHIFDAVSENIDRIEESIIKNNAVKSISTEQIFNIKRTLILFHKAMIANREVITSIEKGYIKKMTKKEVEKFRDIYNDIVQLVDVIDTDRQILTGVLETYITTLSNNMNNIIKKMTGYASLVLVPTLISGIYGMNFDHMPELHWIFGYPFALLIMVVSSLLLYYFFRKMDWI